MNQTPDDPNPPEPAAGLTDPRTGNPGPEILGGGPDTESGTSPGDRPAGEPPDRDDPEDNESEPGGLLDPRPEIPDPTRT